LARGIDQDGIFRFDRLAFWVRSVAGQQNCANAWSELGAIE